MDSIDNPVEASEPFQFATYMNDCIYCSGADPYCIGCNELPTYSDLVALSQYEPPTANPSQSFVPEEDLLGAPSPALDLSTSVKYDGFSLEPALGSKLHLPSVLSSAPHDSPTIRNTSLQMGQSSDPLEVNFGSERIPTYRRRTKSKSQVSALQNWFRENPNPTPAELSEYAQLIDLEKSQVRDWFANQRRPARRPNHPRSGDQQKKCSPSPNPASRLPISTGGSSMRNHLSSIPTASDTMLDRWRNSPPEEEPANLTAIKNALASSCSPPEAGSAPSFERAPRAIQNSRSFDNKILDEISKETRSGVKFTGVPYTAQDLFRKLLLDLVKVKNLPRPYEITFSIVEDGIELLDSLSSASAWYLSAEDASISLSILSHLNEFELDVPDSNMCYFRQLSLENHEITNVQGGSVTYSGNVLPPIVPQLGYNSRQAPSVEGSGRSSGAPSATSSQSTRRRYKNMYRRTRSSVMKSYQGFSQADLKKPVVFDIYRELDWFKEGSRKEVLEFPSTLSKSERQLVRELAVYLDLESSTYKNGKTRWIVVRKVEVETSSSGQSITSEDAIAWKTPNSIQCTFCNVKFENSRAWAEHETTWHKPKREWVCCCARHGGINYSDPCTFCGREFTISSDFFNHACRPYCPELIPVFNFESELVEHLKTVHKFSQGGSFGPSTWKQPGFCDPPMWNCAEWHCKMCTESVRGWKARLEHISRHWEKGKKKESWFWRQKAGIGPETALPESHKSSAVQSLQYQFATSERQQQLISHCRPVPPPLPPDARSWLERGRAWFSRRK